MAIYELAKDRIVAIEKTKFEDAGLRERDDLQRLLRAQIDVVCPDVMVISEGFRDWEDSRRELDLLAIDKDANLVVIELKRTSDGGHAELQAIRYAAMVSTMTFGKAVEVYTDFLRSINSSKDAYTSLLDFLGWDEPDEDRFAQDVRIVLVSADFSRELTTSVMWLNERDMDIRCVRLRPYKDGERVLVDVQQVIPLPEAQDYIVRIREKAVQERQDRAEQGDRKLVRKAFWESLLERSIEKHGFKLFANVSASTDSWIAAGSGLSGVHYTYLIRQHNASVQFALDCQNKALNKARYDYIANQRADLEQAIGQELQWQRCNDLRRSCFAVELNGGYRDDPEGWHQLQDDMIAIMSRFENALKGKIDALRNIETLDEGEIENDGGI